MSQGPTTIVYPVKDVTAAKAIYTQLLGAEPYVDTPYYVGFKAGEQEIGLDPNGHKSGRTGPINYWQVSDMTAGMQALVDAGATVEQEPRDVGGGLLIALVADADGNIIGLSQPPS